MERTRLVNRSRGRPRSDTADAAILDAAIALIRDVGYDNVTMEAIADRAGVGKATLYRRWSSKEPLVVDAIGGIMRSMPVPDTGTLGGDVRRALKSASAMYEDPATRHLLSGLVAAMARNDAIAHAVRRGFVGTWRDAIRQIVDRAVTRGELRPHADVGLITNLLSGPLFHRFLIDGGRIDERFTRRVADIVLRGLTS
jgi:AcrR family transcriptional regulator